MAASLTAAAGLGSVEAGAQEPAGSTRSEASTGVPGAETASGPQLGVRVGYAVFSQSQSNALEHRFKPSARVDLMWALSPTWDLGAAVRGVLSTSPNYGVWAGMVQVRFRFLGAGGFTLAALAGVGLGYNAPILHDDLESGFPVLPYASLALQPVFAVNESLALGAEFEAEQLSVFHAGVLGTYRFD